MYDVDLARTITYLNSSFADATSSKGRFAQSGSTLHNWQVDFSYFINDMQKGPKYIVPKIVARANDLIERIRTSQ